MSYTPISSYSSISAIGTFTDVNTGTGAHLFLDPARCAGGADADLRTSVENKGGTDGVNVSPAMDGAQIITLAGPILISTSFADYATVLGDLKDALELMKAAPDDLVHGGGSIPCWKYSRIDPAWDRGIMVVTFSLLAV